MDWEKSCIIFSTTDKKQGISLYWNDEQLIVEEYKRKQKYYFCGKELLRFSETKTIVYQILSVDYAECAFGRVYSDGEIEIIFKDTSLVPNKQDSGGQSAKRYQQNRQNEIIQWFKEINEKLKNVEGKFYVGMSSIYFKRFFDLLSTYNHQKIIERKSCEYSGITGIYQMVRLLEKEKGN